MNVGYTRTALDALEDAPAAVRKAFWKQMKFLEHNLLHPSLHAKKYNEAKDQWQGRVNRDWVSTSRSKGIRSSSPTSYRTRNDIRNKTALIAFLKSL